ncbi:MAG: thioesterase [Bacteroidales bacterium]|nr:thioesterase [Bacteroidales bacterium]
MDKYFDKEFELRYFEMDQFGQASSTAILTLLEETAAAHCASINQSLYDLEQQNIGWVLLSGVMKMDRYPSYNEKITIRTWLSSYTLVKGYRENIIYDENMNIIGKSKGLWVFFDITRRRPTQIFDSIREDWSYCSDESISHDIKKKILPLESAKYVNEFKVNRYDVDTNQHLNNIRYLQYLSESIPEEITDNYYLHSIDGRFIAEAQYRDTIVSLTERDIYENSFTHTMLTQGDNKVCATAKTVWKKRK